MHHLRPSVDRRLCPNDEPGTKKTRRRRTVSSNVPISLSFPSDYSRNFVWISQQKKSVREGWIRWAMVGKYIRRCFGWEGTRKVEASEEGDFGRGSGEAGRRRCEFLSTFTTRSTN